MQTLQMRLILILSFVKFARKIEKINNFEDHKKYEKFENKYIAKLFPIFINLANINLFDFFIKLF